LAGGDPSRISFFANHPATPERVKNTTAAAKALPRGPGRPIAAPRPAWRGGLDGLVGGPDPANGIFVKNVFQHPGLALALDMPAGWKTKNVPAAAIASEPDGRAAGALQGAAGGKEARAGARVAPPRALEPYREAFARTAGSFPPLRPDERERMTEVRLRPRPARAGESVAAFVSRTGGPWKVDQTAVANGIAANATLDDGFAMKVPIRQRYTEGQAPK